MHNTYNINNSYQCFDKMSSLLSLFKNKSKRNKHISFRNKENLNSRGQQQLQRVKKDLCEALQINSSNKKPQLDFWALSSQEDKDQIVNVQNKQTGKQKHQNKASAISQQYPTSIQCKRIKTLQPQINHFNNKFQQFIQESHNQIRKTVKQIEDPNITYQTINVSQKIALQAKKNRKILQKNRKSLYCNRNTNRAITQISKQQCEADDQSKLLFSRNRQSTIDKLKRQIKFLQGSQFVGLYLNKEKCADMQEDDSLDIGPSTRGTVNLKTKRSNLFCTQRKEKIKSVASSYSYRSYQNNVFGKKQYSFIAVNSTNFPCGGGKTRQQINMLHGQFRNKHHITDSLHKSSNSNKSSFSMAKKYYSNSKARSICRKPFQQHQQKTEKYKKQKLHIILI